MQFKHGERVEVDSSIVKFIKYGSHNNSRCIVENAEGSWIPVDVNTVSKTRDELFTFVEGEAILYNDGEETHEATFDYYLSGFGGQYAHVMIHGRGKYIDKSQLTRKSFSNKNMKHVLDKNY